MLSKRRLNHTFLLLLLLLSVATSLAQNGSGSRGDAVDDDNVWNGQEFESETSSNRKLWIAHGATAATAWGILVPLAIGSSLIRKIFEIGLPKGFWFQLHRGLNALAAILTIVSFSIAVYIFNKKGEDEHFTEETHHTVGLVIFILTLLQALNGLFRPHLPHTVKHVVDKGDDNVAEDEIQERALEKEPTPVVVAKKSSARIVWEIGHRIMAISLLAMTWWQVQTGLELFLDHFEDATNLSPVFFGVAGGICAASLILFMVQTIVMK
jgi:hypothetical protein